MSKTVSRLVSVVIAASEAAKNEAQLRHELESALKAACEEMCISWTPFQLERTLKTTGKPAKFADVAHGAVIIEYEPPKSFSGRVGSKALHARCQAEEYAVLISAEEGRSLCEYVLVIWDGSHISFGQYCGDTAVWEELLHFDLNVAKRLLASLEQDGRPLVHPQLLQSLVGPDSKYGISLIPELYRSICRAESVKNTSKTKMLFTEWRRLFSQVVGFQPEPMKKLLSRQEISHDQPYQENPAAYLFALNTYIAIIAKVVAACALPNPSQNILAASVPVVDRMRSIETGELFEHAGILNMLSGDFFSWYLDDHSWNSFRPHLDALLGRLAGVDFTITKKDADTTRDLFKGIYERFIPKEVRHALGEFYTPDWLAEHGMDLLEWNVEETLTDPTCGSGTFLLEAVRRRRRHYKTNVSAKLLLEGLHGIDLNPLAVLAAKGSLAVFLSPFLNPAEPVRLPIYLADAINPATVDLFSNYSHILQTEVGPKEFSVPRDMIHHSDFFRVFAQIRMLIDADVPVKRVCSAIQPELLNMGLNVSDIGVINGTVENLVSLHEQGWNGIWCAILADRFAAGAISPAECVCGNPPWVKWSNLPKQYALSIQEQCKQLGVFSTDKWVGGIESDISTVVTYQAIRHYLAPSGRLGFFLPDSVFTTESSAGFRKFSIDNGRLTCKVLLVEDYSALNPFDGVSNHPTFLVLKRDAVNVFPVPYRSWTPGAKVAFKLHRYSSAADFRKTAKCNDGLAAPVPGGNGARPWLVGSAAEQAVFKDLFASPEPAYKARKGVTTDRNGIYWVEALASTSIETVTVRNAADIGRTKGIPVVTGSIETKHLFPMLRGRGVTPFKATPEEDLRIIMPQREMHGDPNLAIHSPLTFKFLNKFKSHLEQRSSLKRFQKGKEFYSLWSTGPYTFSPFKVLWREMGDTFAAAYIGSASTKYIGEKVVIPDHKLYFIPVESEEEAAYLTGFLNVPIIAGAVAAYAARLSLGASVAEYLNIPRFDDTNSEIKTISDLAQKITIRGGKPSLDELESINALVKKLLAI